MMIKIADEALRRERERRGAAEASARSAQSALRAERLAVNHLQDFTARLSDSDQLQPLLDAVLAEAISLQHADFGCIELCNPTTHMLEIAAQHGFGQNFLDRFRECRDDSSMCGRAISERLVVEDLRSDVQFAPHSAVAQASGIRAVQFTPLFTGSGAPLGVISTHFRSPYLPSDRELRFTELYGRMLGVLIEQHRTAEALRLSEERFRRYFTMGLIGMAMTSVEKGCLEVNDEICRILGYERHELLRRSWAEMTHPDDLAADLVQFNRVLSGEIDGYTLDKRWIRKDGRVINSVMAAQCVRRADRSVDYFVTLVLDTKERQRAKDELARSERRFRMLVESIPHHVWSVDREGALCYCNQQLADYTELKEEQLRFDPLQALHPDDVERTQATLRTALERGTSYEMEHRIRRSDGVYRRFISRAVNVKGASGRPVEWLGTSSDVEDRLQAEDALRTLRAQQACGEQVMTVEQISASIVHEINQPLAAVIANGHACMRWLTGESIDLREAVEATARIVRDAKRAAEVVTRIRSFLRRESPQAIPTDLRGVVSEAMAIVEGDLRDQGVSLRMESGAGLPAVAADRIQVQQVILNLVRNALDAMSLVRDRARTLRVELRRYDRSSLRIAVCDSGVGLPPEQRDNVFDAFHTNKPNGMGMGLAISRSIVEAHGGRLWATPNESYGETFHFTLPIAAV